MGPVDTATIQSTLRLSSTGLRCGQVHIVILLHKCAENECELQAQSRDYLQDGHRVRIQCEGSDFGRGTAQVRVARV